MEIKKLVLTREQMIQLSKLGVNNDNTAVAFRYRVGESNKKVDSSFVKEKDGRLIYNDATYFVECPVFEEIILRNEEEDNTDLLGTFTAHELWAHLPKVLGDEYEYAMLDYNAGDNEISYKRNDGTNVISFDMGDELDGMFNLLVWVRENNAGAIKEEE